MKRLDKFHALCSVFISFLGVTNLRFTYNLPICIHKEFNLAMSLSTTSGVRPFIFFWEEKKQELYKVWEIYEDVETIKWQLKCA